VTRFVLFFFLTKTLPFASAITKQPVGSDHIEDMVNLPELTEGAILENLKKRFQQEIIYVRFTFCSQYPDIPSPTLSS